MLSGHPFQKLCYIPASSDLPEVLFAASGPYLCWYDPQQGLVTRWTTDEKETARKPDVGVQHVNGNDDGGDGRPAKRPRLSGDDEGLLSGEESEESVDIISERVKGQRRKPKPVAKTKLPGISHMLATADGRHLLVVTSDDKCIRLLERHKSGRLKNISERYMPKRLCAIALTRDEQTIVAGDKFGDVYSLPLFPIDDVSRQPPTSHQEDSALAFKPSASELTVHTKGNLEALRQQQLVKKTKPKREGATFEHNLLLGHVSLLTDLAIAELDGNQGRRQYILTADRDEHIRISRGVSQAHVIENYCLGHKEFVSKLSILPWQPAMLVAGSGEPSLKVYDWQRGLCLTDLLGIDGALDEIRDYIRVSDQDRSSDSLAVSGIWPVSTGQNQGLILVALEGLPILLSYEHKGQAFTRKSTLHLTGNALDLAVADGGRSVIVSVDTIHQPSSMRTWRNEPLNSEEAIICFAKDDADTAACSTSVSEKEEGQDKRLWICLPMPDIHKALASKSVMATVQPEEGEHRKAYRNYSRLGEDLYGLENLRKQRSHTGVEGDEASGTIANGGPQEADANGQSNTYGERLMQ